MPFPHPLRLLSILILGATLMSNPPAHANPDALPSDAEGFAFLDGDWRVHHRKLEAPLSGRVAWKTFEGTARFHTLVEGLMSVEELSDGEGKPYGGAVRSFDRNTRRWSDRWLSVRDGVLNAPVEGVFVEGVGTFTAPDTWEGKTILVRGIWTRLSPDVVSWEQAASTDEGKSWETNWQMRFERLKPAP